jgi:hypothetical protein
MSSYKINISKANQPHAMALLLKKKNVKRGDKVKLVADEAWTTVAMMGALMVVVLALYMLQDKRKKLDAAQKLLDDLYKDYKSPEELEAQIKQEYDVTVEIEDGDGEKKFWKETAARGMAKAYGNDEPDYSDVKLLEPNPQYKPWKKAQ